MAARGTQQLLGCGAIDDPWADLLVAIVERAKADAAGKVAAEPSDKLRSQWQKDAKAFLSVVTEDPALLWC